MKVTIVGAGFAGLTLAYQLLELGIEVEIFEKQGKVGGLIDTLPDENGMVETAANALMSDRNVENLFADLNLTFAERLPSAKKRYIFWEKPSRWPLSWSTSFKAAKGLFNAFVRGDEEAWPESGESVEEWATRLVNREFCERMVAPALQGIYAGDVRKLSASLILKSMLKDRPPKGDFKGSVAPPGGMGELMDKLAGYIEQKGSRIQLKTAFTMPEYITNPLVIATSAWSAADLLKSAKPQMAQILERCESLPLIRAVCFFQPSDDDLEGFGCLFPTPAKFNSLGVLFDNCVFSERSKVRAESWIIGGALNPSALTASDPEVIDAIVADRYRLMGSRARPLTYQITRWQRALPHYTCAWEDALRDLKNEPPLYLHGNYLGQLGLSRILNRSVALAAEIKANHG